MPRRRAATRALATLALVLAAPAAAFAECSYDFDLSYTAGGDVRVSVLAACSGAVQRTHLSVSPGFNFVWEYGNFAQVVVEDEPGGQLYCANGTATYWDGPFLALDAGDGGVRDPLIEDSRLRGRALRRQAQGERL